MRILWISHRDLMHPRSGGAERTIMEVTTRLFSLDYDVTVLSTRWPGSKGVDSFSNVRIRRFGNNFFLHLYVPVFLMKNNFDLVVNDLGHAVPWPSTTLLRKKNIVFFRHLHARSLQGQVNRLLALIITAIERCYFLIYHDSIFLTESSTSRNNLLKLGIKFQKIVMNPPGVDPERYKLSEKTAWPSLVYFGGYRKYKRPLDVVSIFKKISNQLPEARFTFIGDGPELKSVRSAVKNHDIADRTNFTGRLNDSDLAKIVSQSWVNVHTSVTEGWGYSILEASASGTPTIAYSVPGVVDAIEDGKNGIKVKDGDIHAFVEAALTILRDPIPWQASSRKVAEKYSWDKTAGKWDQLIKEVVNGK